MTDWNGPTAPRDWAWEDDELTRDLVRELQTGVNPDTRAFLRPIFKWMKAGVRKNGQKDDALVEKAFAFVEWMVQLSREGDVTRGIHMVDNLQPNYALNTIVTSSQRAGSLPEAKRAFDAILAYGCEPDVFTYTALIDVTARNGDVPGAIQIYEDMRGSRSKPNIVTITTLIRSIGYNTKVEAIECLRFLAHAREQEAFDEALYLDALSACAVRNAMIAARAVLKDLTTHDVTLRNSDRLVHALAKVLSRRADKDVLVEEWLNEGIITQQEIDRLEAASDTPGTKAEGPKTLGCLGNQTSDSVRLAVVQHDINRLVERIRSGAMVTTNDFETLIHQCRKRKWKEEVGMIVGAMRRLATAGWEGSTPETSLPVQAHLLPTSKTYVSVVDAYLASGDEELAWSAFQEVGDREELVREQALYRKYVRGCYLLTNCTHIRAVVQLAIVDEIVFTNRMCVELARMHGYRHKEGIDLIMNQLPVANPEKKQSIMEELATSCAYKNNTDGVIDVIEALAHYGLRRSAKTEMAAFLCCLQHAHYRDARQLMHSFQARGMMLDIPMYDSLLREMYFKYTRRGSTFDESSRAVAIRTLQMRRALFESAIRERDALEQWMQTTHHAEYKAAVQPTQDVDNHSVVDEHSLKYWCQLHALECAPLMFTQHVVEVITTIRDKESKLAKQQTIRDALFTTPDPYLFNLRAVTALHKLDLTYRGQGKLAKQMLSILMDQSVEQHHIEYCFSQLDVLSVHIVKELDDVIELHRHDERQILDYCLDALESDNVDKTIGFIVSKDALYTLETATFLIPKLAELYIVQGIVTVLQFFKPDCDHATEIKRIFLREVVDVESLSDEGDSTTMPLTRRAIVEFKMEHESEFMPFVMMRPPRDFNVPTNTVDDSVCLKCPLPATQVVIVDQDDAVALAYDVLMQSRVTRIGIDAEWRPDARGYAQSQCSVLQIACDTHIFLFDLLELAISDLEELFAHLFCSETIVKLGYALDGDLRRLQWSFEDVKCFDVVKNVVDFAHDDVAFKDVARDEVEGDDEEQLCAAKARRRHRGLSALMAEVLGAPLNKTQQKSDWEKRPLSEEQIKYAAMDAFCLLMLHDKVRCCVMY